ncbi:hypothetical protein G3A_15030 [Bacillus sp. 17376]|nr:hypothetical protein G3A_15030 [Bacillus sp. 17376]
MRKEEVLFTIGETEDDCFICCIIGGGNNGG